MRRHFLTQSWLFHVSLALGVLALLGLPVLGDEFADLAASFGTTLTLSGLHHATTSNPDGTAINFWTNSYEGALASTVSIRTCS